MISGRSSTPVRRAVEENSTAKTTSSEGSDSGYGSAGNMTESSMTGPSQDFANGVALPRRIFERRVTKLRPFDREIPQLTQHRFHDLHELFERPLCEYLNKANMKPNAVSFKLKVLGECEATAKPWIVVLCDKTESKKIRQFFNQSHIKAEYRPSHPDEFLPSFEVFVYNRPPRPMAGTEIYGDDDERVTTCGRIIKVGDARQPRFATLGGVIKVVKSPGVVMIYGMTAGHVLAQQPLEQDQNDPINVRDAEEEDEGFYSGEEDYELDDAFDCDKEAWDFDINSKGMQNESQKQHSECYSKIGRVFTASTDGTRTGHDLDWALVEFDRATDYQPNLLALPDSEKKSVSNQTLRVNEKPTEDGSSRTVSLLSGMGGVKKGKLSTCLSFLMLGPAKAFTKTYTLILLDGSVLNAGDCGSWVVDPLTCEVYGHVVASDAMGDTYVVPFQATLRDMEEKLGAVVSLPTEADIHMWHKTHSKATVRPVAVPIASKPKNTFNNPKISSSESPSKPQKPAGHSSSQASTRSASVINPSAPIEEHCDSPNARTGGSSQGVRSSLQHHQRTSKNHKSEVPEISKELAKSASGEHPKDAQYKASENTSTHQKSPINWSIRSICSGFRKTSGSDSQPRDKEKKKSSGYSEDSKNAGSASLKKPAGTKSPTSTTKDPKQKVKLSPQKDPVLHPSGGKLSAPSKGLRVPPASTVDRRISIPTVNPFSSRHRNSGENALPSSSRLAPPPAHGREKIHENISDSHQQSHNGKSGQVSYEGYTFTKYDASHTGQKGSWAVTLMVPMPVSQSDLEEQVIKNRKKQTSYNDDKMKGNKRKQVDNLIQERTKMDGDYGFEYVVASIKLDTRNTKGRSIETVSMQVILKRQLRAGLPQESSAAHSSDFHPQLTSRIMDVTGSVEPVDFKDYSRGSQGVYADAFAPSIGQGAFPMSPASGQAFGQGGQHADSMLPPFFTSSYQPDPIYSPTQSMIPLSYPPNAIPSHSMIPPPYPPRMLPAQSMMQSPYPPNVIPALPSPVLRHSHPPNWSNPRPPGIPIVHEENLNTKGHIEKVRKSNQEREDPKIIDLRNKSHKKDDYDSDFSSLSDGSLGLHSDEAWTRTEATSDTVFSAKSSEISKERSHNNDKSVVKLSDREKVRPVSRVYRRAEHRRSSFSPARRTSDASFDSFDESPRGERLDRRLGPPRHFYHTHHRDHEYYDIEPAIGFRAGRSSRPRGSSVSAERSHHNRASSHDPDRPMTRLPRASIPLSRRPEVYQEPTHPYPRSMDLHDSIAEQTQGQKEWERDRFGKSRDMDDFERKEREYERSLEARRARERQREGERREMEERLREIERRESRAVGRDGWRGTRAYDDYDMPRRRRLSDDYYY